LSLRFQADDPLPPPPPLPLAPTDDKAARGTSASAPKPAANKADTPPEDQPKPVVVKSQVIDHSDAPETNQPAKAATTSRPQRVVPADIANPSGPPPAGERLIDAAVHQHDLELYTDPAWQKCDGGRDHSDWCWTCTGLPAPFAGCVRERAHGTTATRYKYDVL
jgi:hypothetical protein